MKLMSFLIRYSPKSMVLAVVAGIISGASNAALLALFNAALNGNQRPRALLIWGFVGFCIFLPVTRYVSEMVLTYIAQNSLFNLRMQLCEQILRAPLRHLEEIGPHRLLSALTEDVPTITGTLVALPLLCINLAVAIGGLIYLGLLSWLVLLAVLGFMVIGIVSYQIPVIRALRSFRLAREEGDALFKHFRALTGGTKELKLHRRRRESFLGDVLRKTASAMREHNIRGIRIYTAAGSWGQVLVFVVIGLILFALPALKELDRSTLVGYTITLLYLMTPLQVIMNTAPNLGRANVSLQKVEDLGLTLEAQGREGDSGGEPSAAPNWHRLDLVAVTHAYQREGETSSFILGPINLTLTQGELVFIKGGNGSGKTTLAKLLTGLYIPQEGEIRLDGKPVDQDTRENYRQYFSMVFSDFHLFESLLGLEGPKLDDRARDYLAELQLTHKVEVKNGALSTTDLSQGQRKRLALLTAYLEDRPIYVFDEWAADQDPVFKEVFYHHILKDLKGRGKTVVVISHDDRYYDVADRIIKLEEGQIDYDEFANRAQKSAADVY